MVEGDGDGGQAGRELPVLARETANGGAAKGLDGAPDAHAEQKLLAALLAAQHGDFTVRLPDGWSGVMGEIAGAFNGLMERNTAVSSELDRVGRTVGREGRMDERFDIGPVGGAWSSQARAINRLIDDLMRPTNEVARVIMAVADGDLSQKMALEIDGKPVKGEFARIGEAVNAMVDELSAFAAEVSRVAREVGTDGKLGGQARVDGVSGIWRDLTDNVNSMASNLTNQVRNISQVSTAVANGDLSQKITVEAKGEVAALADTINSMTDTLRTFADEVTRVAREVGTEGKLGGQAEVPGVAGIWKDLTDNVNSMASNLTDQVRNIAHVSTAVANGDLSQKITVDVKGEILELKDTINTMVDQLSSFADEVTRVAREVGTEGKLGGQAQVEGVSGIWEDLTDNVNSMASNLTSQVRNIAHVSTAVANGDLSQKITVEAKGEVAALADTINSMTDTLRTFADEVTRVAREVGTEGMLGGQADVPGVAGIWKDLTDNVNQLAANLTTQVRAIAEVATAVAQGDLTRSIAVDAQGEVADLKDNINQMIDNLKATTRKNAEQDWLKTNLARISQMMQGQRDLEELSRLIMSELTPTISAQHGAFFLTVEDEDERRLQLIASYGYSTRKGVPNRFRFGEGLVGQAAVERAPIHILEAPADYIQIGSGLGEAPPANIILLPVLFEEQVLGVIELAAFEPFTEVDRTFLEQVIETIGVVLNTIKATMQTEELLQRSQRLTEELQRRQDDLQSANVELQEKARLLAEQNRNIEIKNREIELARRGLEEKAEQLALSSRYKSEFLANVSHELRTPLNSLLILADLLHDNEEANLTDEQLEFVTSIADAGRDLLRLINDILDLSKVESGKMEVSPTDVEVRGIVEFAEQTFHPIASQQGLGFQVRVDPGVPERLRTDGQRLQQVLRNLLSNAFKFTETGTVELEVGVAGPDAEFRSPALRASHPVLCFAVTDSGIGIPEHQLEHIFEAFHQADGTTNRRFGGTGLGLSISREIAQLLGGEIHVDSQVGQGSTFALYLPAHPVWEPGSAAPHARGGERPEPRPTRTGRTGRVVVVSEDLARAGEIERLVRLGGAGQVVVTGATIETIDALHEVPADLLVADLEPAGTVAFNVLRELIEEPDLRDVPVLAYRQRELLRVETAHLQACASTLPIQRLEAPDQLIEAAREHLRTPPLEDEPASDAADPEPDRSGPTPTPPARDDAPLEGTRILLADDDERNVFALRQALERHGMEVVTVTDGRRALAALEADADIDLVLMDLMMPEMDGYEAMRSIRAEPRTEGLPVIALTAQAMRGDRELSLAAGASDYLPKPVDVEELVSTLRRWLQRG